MKSALNLILSVLIGCAVIAFATVIIVATHAALIVLGIALLFAFVIGFLWEVIKAILS